jgi:Tfp pilus assembly protein PilN
MIKINLLGKKHVAAGAVPFALDEKLARLGVTPSDLVEMRPGLIRLAVLLAGVYTLNWLPAYLHEQKIKELDVQLAEINDQSKRLSQELSTKKEIRGKMEQLNKEEVELQRQLNAVSALQKDRGIVFRHLDGLVGLVPQKVWINSIDYKERGFNLRGSSWEYFPINKFVEVLNASTMFTSLNFKGITTESGGPVVQGVPEALQKIKNFDMEFKLKAPGGT